MVCPSAALSFILVSVWRRTRSRHHQVVEPPLPPSRMANSLSKCDCAELVWENGQIITRVLPAAGFQKSRGRPDFSLHDPKARVLEAGFDTSTGKPGGLLQEKGFSGHVKMDSHPGYSHQDSLRKDFRTELFAKFTGSVLKYEIPYSDDEQLVPSANRNWSSRMDNACNPLWGEPELIRPKGDQRCEPSFQQRQASSPPYIRSRDGSSKIPVTSHGLSNWKMLRQEQEEDVQHNNRRDSMNKSYFSKIAALGDKSTVQKVGTAKATTNPVLSRVEGKSEHANIANPIILKPEASVQQHGHSKVVGHGIAFGSTTCANNQVREPNSKFGESVVKGEQEKFSKKIVEPMLASASTCSREASNYPSYSLEGKRQDSEESEQPSQSFEEEPRSAAGAVSSRGASAGSKRNRSAEIHNLSEKGQRERFNKKIRSLQELVPNCKKVDKIAILEETIDYLKILQLQLQFLSMGAGPCMPPLMVPPPFQQVQAAHLPHFSPMGVEMGMGLGLSCSPHLLGAGTLSGIAGTAPQMLGHPGQVLPMSLSSAPFIPLPTGSLTQSIPVPSVPMGIKPVEGSCYSPSSN